MSLSGVAEQHYPSDKEGNREKYNDALGSVGAETYRLFNVRVERIQSGGHGGTGAVHEKFRRKLGFVKVLKKQRLKKKDAPANGRSQIKHGRKYQKSTWLIVPYNTFGSSVCQW